MRHSHCHECGSAYGADQDKFPKSCSACGHVKHMNPTPVAVCLVPCEDGVLGVRRGIAPKIGEMALPGGFVDMETPEQACSRELLEETGVAIDASAWRYASSYLTPGGNILLFFEADVAPIELPPFPFPQSPGVRDETAGIEVLGRGARLAFPSHEAAAAAFLARLDSKSGARPGPKP